MTKSGFLSNFSRAVVLCAHTDDEFGCAGTIRRLIESNVDVYYLALSRCEISVPAQYPKDILETECREATKVLGINPANVEVTGFPVRDFPKYRQEILEKLVVVNRTLRPNLVLLPAPSDTHQDHATVCQEGFRAFKSASIWGYELPQNTISFTNAAFISLTEDHLNRKLESLSCYKSQQFRPYATAEFIKGLATVRGVQCGQKYAEGFEVVRLIV